VIKIVVDVMLKPEIRDPQGEAIAGACRRLGFGEVVSVRQGKRFEIEVEDPGHDGTGVGGAGAGGAWAGGAGVGGAGAGGAGAGGAGAGGAGIDSEGGPLVGRMADLAAELLANPVIEEYRIHSG